MAAKARPNARGERRGTGKRRGKRKKSALSPVRSTALLGGVWRLRPSWPMSPLVLMRDALYHSMVSQHT